MEKKFLDWIADILTAGNPGYARPGFDPEMSGPTRMESTYERPPDLMPGWFAQRDARAGSSADQPSALTPDWFAEQAMRGASPYDAHTGGPYIHWSDVPEVIPADVAGLRAFPGDEGMRGHSDFGNVPAAAMAGDLIPTNAGGAEAVGGQVVVDADGNFIGAGPEPQPPEYTPFLPYPDYKGATFQAERPWESQDFWLAAGQAALTPGLSPIQALSGAILAGTGQHKESVNERQDALDELNKAEHERMVALTNTMNQQIANQRNLEHGHFQEESRNYRERLKQLNIGNREDDRLANERSMADAEQANLLWLDDVKDARSDRKETLKRTAPALSNANTLLNTSSLAMGALLRDTDGNDTGPFDAWVNKTASFMNNTFGTNYREDDVTGLNILEGLQNIMGARNRPEGSGHTSNLEFTAYKTFAPNIYRGRNGNMAVVLHVQLLAELDRARLEDEQTFAAARLKAVKNREEFPETLAEWYAEEVEYEGETMTREDARDRKIVDERNAQMVDLSQTNEELVNRPAIKVTKNEETGRYEYEISRITEAEIIAYRAAVEAEAAREGAAKAQDEETAAINQTGVSQ